MATVKPTMKTSEINKYLAKYKKITFNPGTYKLTAPLIIYSDCTITCKDGVILERYHNDYMVKFYADKNTTEYNGCHDTKWKGGTLKANTSASSCNIFNLVHAKNITISNVVLEGCVDYHSIELNSSTDVTIKNCIFKDQTYKDGKNFREAIQIDFAYKVGVGVVGGAQPTDKCYDGTHCKNITISKCEFINCPNGIGTHVVYEKELYHENITIKDCTFTNIEKRGIRVMSMKNVKISNCDTKILVACKKEGYPLVGESAKQLSKIRYNINVFIDNVTVQ